MATGGASLRLLPIRNVDVLQFPLNPSRPHPYSWMSCLREKGKVNYRDLPLFFTTPQSGNIKSPLSYNPSGIIILWKRLTIRSSRSSFG